MELNLRLQKNFGDFSLALDTSVAGDRIGIFGPSGGGKSTLVAALAGLLKPDWGELLLDGEVLFSSTRKICLPAERRRIALVFQQHELFPHLNVRANLLYGHSRCAPEHRRVDFTALVEVLRLGSLLERGIDSLSGGEKQRVAIGRAVLSNPRLLLMDEPLSALDDSLRFQIIGHLREVSSQFGIPYLFISHSLLEMRLMTDDVLEIESGRIISQGSPEELARRRLGQSPVGYINLLELGSPTPSAGLFSYPWGGGRLLLSSDSGRATCLVELSSKDIILFKQHPEAISARNLLCCRVRSLFSSGRKTGVELDCNGSVLIAEVVQDAVTELGITPGGIVHAAIKASAFRMLPS